LTEPRRRGNNTLKSLTHRRIFAYPCLCLSLLI
jgi:hypothetical protein